MIKELTPEQYESLSEDAQAFYDRWFEQQKIIGPQMKTEGWEAVGNMIWWLHPPSRRSVRIDPTPWSQCHGFGAFEGEPHDPNTEGFLVCWSYHTEGGEPVDGEYGAAYGGLWTSTYTTALVQARRMRDQIMGEPPRRPPHVQLDFDCLLERKR